MKVGDMIVCEIPIEELNMGAIYTVASFKQDLFGHIITLKEYAKPDKTFNAARFRIVKEVE